jgi:hypothetical protein
MTKVSRPLAFLACLAAMAAAAAPAGDGAHGAPIRAIAEVMKERPLAEVDGILRAWALEKSEEFASVLPID